MLVSSKVERKKEQKARSRKSENARRENGIGVRVLTTGGSGINSERKSGTSETNGATVARFAVKRLGESESTQHGKGERNGL